MARKINEDKFKVAFIFINEGCNPKKDRSVIESAANILKLCLNRQKLHTLNSYQYVRINIAIT